MNDVIIQGYTLRAETAQQQADYFKKQVNTYSLSRLAAFVLVIVAVFVAAIDTNYELLSAAAFIFILVFGWLVQQQNKYEAQLRFFKNLRVVNDNELASINARKNIYKNGDEFGNDKHYYTADLDIFGPSSLFNLINRCATTPGNDKLVEWLNAPAHKQIVLSRQEAVKELAAKQDWKLDLQADLMFAIKQDKDRLKLLLAYLQIPINVPNENILSVYIQLVPILILLSFVFSFFYYPAIYCAGVLAVINGRLTLKHNNLADKADLLAGRIGKELDSFATVFKRIENEDFTSLLNQQVAAQIKEQQNGPVSASIRLLSKLINRLNARMNLVVSIFLNGIFVWNIRQIIAIENWKRNNHQGIETAFKALGEFEALISLSSLSSNYPHWCYPQIADGEGYTLSAKNIAHPLINTKNSVDNDFYLNDELRIDIITGSNMAGKSTFLRTLGINTVLALCGAPVCAKNMQVSVMTIISYMRIKDSLNESTSTFKAELDRLQMLLAAVVGDEKIYFLIDEMLRGTNSVDKYKGSKAVIEQLIKKRGVGLVATHDLQIAQLEQKYPDYVRNFYFDIQVVNGEMLFDYKIKHGECKTFNASLLLKQIGIDVDAA